MHVGGHVCHSLYAELTSIVIKREVDKIPPLLSCYRSQLLAKKKNQQKIFNFHNDSARKRYQETKPEAPTWDLGLGYCT